MPSIIDDTRLISAVIPAVIAAGSITSQRVSPGGSSGSGSCEVVVLDSVPTQATHRAAEDWSTRAGFSEDCGPALRANAPDMRAMLESSPQPAIW